MSEYTTQDLYDNLNYLNETKEQIKQALIDKEQSVSDADTFRSYADKIRNIETGVDTSDATAVPNDIISPKTAYVNGEKITGSMPNNGALNYTPSEQEQSIPAGYTSGGTVNAIDYSNTLTPAEYTTALDTANEILTGMASGM